MVSKFSKLTQRLKSKASSSQKQNGKKGQEEVEAQDVIKTSSSSQIIPTKTKGDVIDGKHDVVDISKVKGIVQLPPEDDQSEKDAVLRPICELWDEAYNDLRLQNSQLIIKYETILSTTSTENHTTGSGDTKDQKINRRLQMEHVLSAKMEEVEQKSQKWKLGEKDIGLKDLAIPIVNVVKWATENIGPALALNPYTSIAWAGVGVLLPLFLNPTEQAASLADSLKRISHLIKLSVIREYLYERNYQSSNANPQKRLDMAYREALKDLYISILKFQITSVCYFSKDIFSKLARDVVKWNDWKSLQEDVQEKEAKFLDINSLCKDSKYDDECRSLDEQHKESMQSLNSMAGDVSALRRAVEETQRDEARKTLLDWLSTVDPSENYNKAHQKHRADTGSWLIENDLFGKWKTESDSFLWLHGKAGAGKSVLSTVIKHLEDAYVDDPRSALGYFYFSFNDSRKQDTATMISSLIKQFCCRRFDTPDSVKKLSEYKNKGHRPDLKTLEYIFATTIRGFSKVFVVLDALDECPDSNGERETLLNCLCRIQDLAYENLHFLCTSRREDNIERTLNPLLSKTSKVALDLRLHQDAIDNDIKLYTNQELSSAVYNSWPAAVKDDVKAALIDKANGMFQYVACQFNSLRELRSGAAVRRALKDLPEGLDATYDRMLINIDPNFQERVISVLKWLAVSRRPLIVEELAEAFILDYNLPVPFNEDEQLFEPNDILKYLSGLVETTEITANNLYLRSYSRVWYERKALEIRFCHFSIKEYLISSRINSGPASKFSISNETSAHMYVAESCLAYHLQISEHELATEKVILKYTLWEYASQEWPSHMKEIADVSWTQSFIEKATKASMPGSSSLLNMVRIRNVEADDKIKKLGKLAPPLYYAASYDMDGWMKFLLAQGADVNECSKVAKYGTALQAATHHRYQDIINTLLEHGADINIQGGEYGNALQAAASNGNTATMKLLLSKGSNINAQGGRYGNALQAAAEYGNRSAIKILVEKGADVNAPGGLYGNSLSAAVSKKAYEISRLLMSLGAKADLPPNLRKETRHLIYKRYEIDRFPQSSEVIRLEKLWEDPEKFFDKVFNKEAQLYIRYLAGKKGAQRGIEAVDRFQEFWNDPEKIMAEVSDEEDEEEEKEEAVDDDDDENKANDSDSYNSKYPDFESDSDSSAVSQWDIESWVSKSSSDSSFDSTLSFNSKYEQSWYLNHQRRNRRRKRMTMLHKLSSIMRFHMRKKLGVEHDAGDRDGNEGKREIRGRGAEERSSFSYYVAVFGKSRAKRLRKGEDFRHEPRYKSSHSGSEDP